MSVEITRSILDFIAPVSVEKREEELAEIQEALRLAEQEAVDEGYIFSLSI